MKVAKAAEEPEAAGRGVRERSRRVAEVKASAERMAREAAARACAAAAAAAGELEAVRQIPERARAAAVVVASVRARPSQTPTLCGLWAAVEPTEAVEAREAKAQEALAPTPTDDDADDADADATDQVWGQIENQVGGRPMSGGGGAGRGRAGAPLSLGAAEVEEAAAVMRGLRERLKEEETAVKQRRATRAQRKAQRHDAGVAAAAAVARARRQADEMVRLHNPTLTPSRTRAVPRTRPVPPT